MGKTKAIEKKIFSLKTVKRVLIGLVFILVFDFVLFPAPALADNFSANNNDLDGQNNLASEKIIPKNQAIINNLPQNNEKQIKKTAYHTLTAYNSEVAQCDSTPCITANGFNLCEHGIEDSVAANFLPFGAKIRIPELFGDQIFVVRDRMNSRYTDRVDIWMLDKDDAKKFGIRVAKIEILEP